MQGGKLAWLFVGATRRKVLIIVRYFLLLLDIALLECLLHLLFYLI